MGTWQIWLNSSCRVAPTYREKRRPCGTQAIRLAPLHLTHMLFSWDGVRVQLHRLPLMHLTAAP